MSLERFVLSYGGFGMLPTFPALAGTAGAAMTAAAVLILAPSASGRWPLVCVACALGALAVTVAFTPALQRDGGPDESKDPQLIVTDEVAGYWTTLLGAVHPDLTHIVLAFFVFRLLDVLKPWPAAALERLPGGWGVSLDDLAAGAYGAVILLALDHL